ncbi:replication initiator [Parafrankia sp. FMc2]|uniref:replication initiator n=1 Tax=Parafrankia sp. FMc2 TaxID=3233196 RepID=UPI0034D4CB08
MLPEVLAASAARIADGTFTALWSQIQRTNGCAHPVRLTGTIHQADRATGEIRTVFDSASLPDGTILVPCGNRRATVCPSCSYLYAGDAWQIVHAGVSGGFGVPDTVAEHPGLFVTVTAPSFGLVHSRRSNHGPAVRCSTHPGRCRHGRPRGCPQVHPDDDPRLGAPICQDCADSSGLVVWNRYAARLWKRTVDLTYRRMARLTGLPLEGSPGNPGIRRRIRISYIKVAEAQRRGAIHYHGVLRLDDATMPPGTWEPPGEPWATAQLLATCWRWAVRHAVQPCPDPHRYDLPSTLVPHPVARPPMADVRWGEQERTVALTVDGGELTPRTVGNYLAKYVTKSVTDSGALDRRIRNADDLHERLAFLPDHQAELVRAAWRLAARPAFRELGMAKWAHQFGFNGHWITKSRSYSTTFAQCRERRRTWARAHTPAGGDRAPLDAWGRPEDDDVVITFAEWEFHASGYARTGDRLLAEMAADQARSRREAARDDRAQARIDDGPGAHRQVTARAAYPTPSVNGEALPS